MKYLVNRQPDAGQVGRPVKYSVFSFFKYLALPLLFSLWQPIFYFANNADILLVNSLFRMAFLFCSLAVLLYVIFLLFVRGNFLRAAITTFIFLIFFNTYGIVYKYLLQWDIVLVRHYTLLPLYILLAIYTNWLVSKIKSAYQLQLWKIASFALLCMVIFNTVRIIPAEINKIPKDTEMVVESKASSSMDQKRPDIYYIVLDEASGFEPMRKYWNAGQAVDQFVESMKGRGFFVAENSHGNSTATVYELASRLNYQDYLCCDEFRTYFEAIANNKVFRYLKYIGYTTISYEEITEAFPADIPIISDYLYEKDLNAPSVAGEVVDEFGLMVLDDTMISAFSTLYRPIVSDTWLKAHRNMIYNVLENIDRPDVPSPKLVYVHLLLPHVPFMFDAHGNVIDPQYQYNWNYYLGNYLFALRAVDKMVDTILEHANPNLPPVIIVQSDHGARNHKLGDNVLLENFPEEYKRSILFLLYLPGYDYSSLPQEINPIDTFPLIFNHLFDANIPYVTEMKNNQGN